MAEQNQARMLSAAFPTPPPFYKHFTKANVSKLRELGKEATKNKTEGSEEEGQAAIDVLSLPTELRYLIPPEPPADGKYQSFGANYDLAQPTQSLEAAGIPQLYPAEVIESEHFDPTPHLKTLMRSVLFNILEMLGIQHNDPTQGVKKVEDIQTILYNIHDLINRYRPHQARETMILMLEERVEQIRADNARIKETKEKMAALLTGMEALQDKSTPNPLAESVKTTLKDEANSSAERARQEAQNSMWDALDNLGD